MQKCPLGIIKLQTKTTTSLPLCCSFHTEGSKHFGSGSPAFLYFIACNRDESTCDSMKTLNPFQVQPCWWGVVPALDTFPCTTCTTKLLPHCCHKTTKCNRVLAERFNLYCHTPAFASGIIGHSKKIRGITFEAALILFFSMTALFMVRLTAL